MLDFPTSSIVYYLKFNLKRKTFSYQVRSLDHLFQHSIGICQHGCRSINYLRDAKKENRDDRSYSNA